MPVQNGDGYSVTEKVSITGVTLNQTTLSLVTNGANTATLAAAVAPAGTTDDTTVAWTSSNVSVATVDTNGVVTAVADGAAIITATVGGFSDTCTVTVTTT